MDLGHHRPERLAQGGRAFHRAVAVQERGVGGAVEVGFEHPHFLRLGQAVVGGEAAEIADDPSMVPITLLDGARLTRALAPGQVVTTADVEPRDTLALRLYRETVAGLRPRHDER